MEVEAMGKVLVTATIENMEDLFDVEKGLLPRERVRRIEVPDALVDTGATMLLLPKRMVAQLGLRPFRTREARGLGGPIVMGMYHVARLTIQGRECAMDVGEIPDEYPVIIGQLPLEALDWVVDVKNRCLIGNPEHGGEQVIEVFALTGRV
jgi:predicted aspartyl protease